MSFTPRLVFVTASSIEEARHIAKVILEKRLAACVNIVPGVESHYWWKGKLEISSEILLIIKSSVEQFEALRMAVSLHHSYECPEIVAIAPGEMSPDYRKWWETEISTAPQSS